MKVTVTLAVAFAGLMSVEAATIALYDAFDCGGNAFRICTGVSPGTCCFYTRQFSSCYFSGLNAADIGLTYSPAYVISPVLQTVLPGSECGTARRTRIGPGCLNHSVAGGAGGCTYYRCVELAQSVLNAAIEAVCQAEALVSVPIKERDDKKDALLKALPKCTSSVKPDKLIFPDGRIFDVGHNVPAGHAQALNDHFDKNSKFEDLPAELRQHELDPHGAATRFDQAKHLGTDHSDHKWAPSLGW